MTVRSVKMDVSIKNSSVRADLRESKFLDSVELDPFANTRDSRFFFPSTAHEQALSRLFAMLEDGNLGFGVLSGDSGLGKTLLRTVLCGKLDPLRYLGVSIENSLLEFDDLLLEIISQMHGERVQSNELPDRYSRLAEFKSILTERVVQSGKHLVITIDEAQGLGADTLEGLRLLSNISAEQYNLMSIILIGNNKLKSNLRRLAGFSQRIGVKAGLLPLDDDESRKYVQHRLQVAGYQGDVPLSDKAWQLLYQRSGGVPREINLILKRASNHLALTGPGFTETSLEDAIKLQPAQEAIQPAYSQELRF